jgi:hypothetical protein
LLAYVESMFGCLQISLNDHARHQIPNLDGIEHLLQNDLILAHLVDYLSSNPAYLNIRRETEEFDKCSEKSMSDHLRGSILKEKQIANGL